MKRLITILLLFVSIICSAQLPSEIKHVEIVSEVADTMIVLNKTDLDKINTAFYMLDVYDSLNVVSEEMISTLKVINNNLENVIEQQKYVIDNQEIQIKTINSKNKDVISDLEKQVKRANRWKAFWEGTTGVSVVAVILLAIF